MHVAKEHARTVAATVAGYSFPLTRIHTSSMGSSKLDPLIAKYSRAAKWLSTVFSANLLLKNRSKPETDHQLLRYWHFDVWNRMRKAGGTLKVPPIITWKKQMFMFQNKYLCSKQRSHAKCVFQIHDSMPSKCWYSHQVPLFCSTWMQTALFML